MSIGYTFRNYYYAITSIKFKPNKDIETGYLDFEYLISFINRAYLIRAYLELIIKNITSFITI